MVDMTIIGGISNSLNVALNISKALLGIRDQSVIQEKIVELTSQIIDAQQSTMAASSAQANLIERINDLEKQIIEMEAWETEKERYSLKAVSKMGSLAYILKSTMTNGEPPHCICANCYQSSKKSILQGLAELDRGFQVLACPECKTRIIFEQSRLTDVLTHL